MAEPAVSLDDALQVGEEELAIEVVGVDRVVGVAARDEVVAGVLETEAKWTGDAVKLGEERPVTVCCGEVVAISAHLSGRFRAGMCQCKI
jgi:hypothetical protein